MGMYTTVSGWVDLKKDYKVFDEKSLWIKCLMKGDETTGVTKEFLRMSRADCITMHFLESEMSEERSFWRVEVEADMKNYNGEIEVFIDRVLPLVADDWSLFVQYEEWVESIKATRTGGYRPEEAKIDW